MGFTLTSLAFLIKTINKPLVRAADIIANRIYHTACENKFDALDSYPNLDYVIQPKK